MPKMNQLSEFSCCKLIAKTFAWAFANAFAWVGSPRKDFDHAYKMGYNEFPSIEVILDTKSTGMEF